MAIVVREGPQAQDDFASGSEHQILSIDILANDRTGSRELWSLDQDDLAVLTENGAPVVLSSGATVWFAGGQLQYDPGQAFNHLSAGETALDQFTYSIRMANGSVSWATVSVTISGEDDPVAGVVTDGYVAGATVFIDVNENGILDTGEPNTISDANGDFTITPSASGPLVAIGGTNIDTGLSNQLTLSAPQGSTVINPLTSLIQALVDSGVDATEAERQVQAALGLALGVSLLSYDILAQPPGDPDALAAQKAAASIAAILNTVDVAAGAEFQQAVLEQLAAAVIAAEAASTTLDLTDPATLEAVLTPALPPVIDAASLAQGISLATTAIQQATSIAEIATTQLNTITGTQGDDTIVAPLGESTLLGLGGNDTFTIGQLTGIDANINGGSGSDLLVLPGLRSDWNFEPVNDSTIRGVSIHGTTVVFSEIETVSLEGNASGFPGLPINSTAAGQELFGTYLGDYMVAHHPGVVLDGTSQGYDVLFCGDDTTVRLSWSQATIGANFFLSDSGFSPVNDSDGGDKMVRGFDVSVLITGSAYNDYFELEGMGTNLIQAGAGDDNIIGGWFVDNLDGGAGDDHLGGGVGPDSLTGGTGADSFFFIQASASSTEFGIDTIHDFEPGVDIIELVYIDADTNTDGDQAFGFIGHQQFSGTAGELRYSNDNGNTLIEADVDGDGIADFQLILTGTQNLDPADFWL